VPAGATLTMMNGNGSYTGPIETQTLNNYGTMNLTGGEPFQVDGNIVNDGTIDMTGGDEAGDLYYLVVGNNTFLSGTGTINLIGGYAAIGVANGPGMITQGAGHTIQGDGLIYINFVNDGTVTNGATGNGLSMYGNVTNNGFMQSIGANGTLAFGGTSVINNGTLQAGTGSTIDMGAALTNYGIIQLAGGRFYDNGGPLNVGSGTLEGSGTVQTNQVILSNAATGASTLAFSIGGTTRGNTYDSMTIDANIVLGGKLNISFTNGFQNSITSSEQFTVMTVASGDTMSGAFANVANGGWLVTTDGYGEFQVNYGTGVYADEIVLSDYQALPEPASFGLMLIGFGFLTKRRRA
jgi:fibronectin-binding autotransporter adhesin